MFWRGLKDVLKHEIERAKGGMEIYKTLDELKEAATKIGTRILVQEERKARENSNPIRDGYQQTMQNLKMNFREPSRDPNQDFRINEFRGRENARGGFHGRYSTAYEYPQQLGQRGNNGVWGDFYGQSRGRHGRLGFGRGGRNGNRMGQGRGSEYCSQTVVIVFSEDTKEMNAKSLMLPGITMLV